MPTPLMLSQSIPQMEGEQLGYPFLLFSVLLSSLLHAHQVPFAFFDPPSGWLISPLRHVEEGVKIGFVESKRKIFAPSISLSFEKLSCSEEEYLTSVKRAHGFDHTKEIRVLGVLGTHSGKAHLLQIDTKHPWGDIRILQAISIKEGYAHIQTAACLKRDFAKISGQLLRSFRSLRISFDVFSTIRDRKKLERSFNYLKIVWKRYARSGHQKGADLFRERAFQESQWAPFTQLIEKNGKDLGICWQMLAIEHLKEELIHSTSI